MVQGFGGGLGGFQVQGPVVVEAVLERTERSAGGVLAKAPAGHHVGAARQVGLAAVAVPDGDVRAPAAADNLVVLILVTGAQGGGVVQVELEIGQRGAGTFGLVVAEGVGILLGHHEARTQAAIFGQRQVQVSTQTTLVPAAISGIGTTAEGFGRCLADQVDGGRGVAGAAQQAVGAAHDVDAFVQVHVQRIAAATEIGAALGLQAINLPVADRVTTRAVVGAPTHLGLVGRYAWGGFQCLLDGVDVAVIHLLAGDGGNRLRCLPWCQCQASGAAGALDRIAQLAGLVGRL
ncbi:hypothetical protein D3C80_913930 [compost metagenome]